MKLNSSSSYTRSRKKPVKELLAQAMVHHQKGELVRAQKYYKHALRIDPNHVDVLHMSGLVAHQLGRNHRGIKFIRKAILIDKSQAVFHKNLAVIYNKVGNWAEAEAASRATLQICPKDADAWGSLGQALAGLERILEAVNAYKRSIKLKPDNALVYCNLATMLIVLNKLEDAEAACHAALHLQPKMAKALHSLGVVQSTAGSLEKAEESFKRAHELDPLNGQTITNLASIYSTKMKFDEAICLFQKVLEDNPSSTEAHFNLGVCYSEKGDLEEALNCFERAIEIDPNYVDAFYALSTSGKFELKPKDLRHLGLMLRSPSVSDENKVKLNFSLAWQADQRELPAPAFTFCAAGNALRKVLIEAKGHHFDPASHTILAKRVEKVFTSRFFKDRNGFGMETELPVFIVGMPRSGTSLVEKILGAHPKIWGAGELNNIPNVVKKLEGEVDKTIDFPEVIKCLERGNSKNIARVELKMLADVSGMARLIDKMPLNYLYLGLIALLYPQARIIHCKRDPRDVAVSCYFQNFVHAHPWSCELHDIGAYYNTYSRIMEHWHKVLPLPILDFQYEDLVSDLEGKSRELIDFLGLEWNSSCLKFYTSSGAVRTASKWQVREPIYKRSVGRWKTFEQYLGPFFHTLNYTDV